MRLRATLSVHRVWPPAVSRVHAYVATLIAATAACAVSIALSGWSLANGWVVLALAIVAAIAERSSVKLSSMLEESISLVPTLFAAVLFGPLAGMVVAAVSMLGDFRRPYLKWATYTCTRSLTGAATGLVAVGVDALIAGDVESVAFGTAAGALTAQLLDIGFAALTLAIRGRATVLEVTSTLAPAALLSLPLYAPLVAFLVFAYAEVSPWMLPLFFVPALAAQRAFVLYQQQRRLTEDLAAVNEQLEKANLSFATALVTTLDARDRYTAGHSAAVAVYARDIAARMGLPVEEQRLVHLCGLVHDVGKIGLPAGLLEKPGALTLDERRQMEGHSIIGERILAQVDDYSQIARIVRHHHERVDGRGYPDGLIGSRIPLLSRIIAVADAYDAMTSDRPYRDAMPSQVARMRLAQAVESQFDTSVVAAFEAILATADEAYRSGARGRFAEEVAMNIAPKERIASVA